MKEKYKLLDDRKIRWLPENMVLRHEATKRLWLL